mmetsp:Transcript_86787/g.136925  ORF Transcript_86787/g.136925 Transcript_86787/m.136925 type:complete len:99 (-) Transcript_86787:80-376(-)
MGINFVLFFSIVFFYFVMEFSMLMMVFAIAAAWVIATGSRFFLLRLPAFEIWYKGTQVYSGMKQWRPPQPEQVFQELRQLGVPVDAAQTRRCAARAGG